MLVGSALDFMSLKSGPFIWLAEAVLGSQFHPCGNSMGLILILDMEGKLVKAGLLPGQYLPAVGPTF